MVFSLPLYYWLLFHKCPMFYQLRQKTGLNLKELDVILGDSVPSRLSLFMNQNDLKTNKNILISKRMSSKD